MKMNDMLPSSHANQEANNGGRRNLLPYTHQNQAAPLQNDNQAPYAPRPSRVDSDVLHTRTPDRTNLSQFFNHTSAESVLMDESHDRVLTAEEITATYGGGVNAKIT